MCGVFMDATFKAIPMTPLAAVSDVNGQRYRQFVPFNFLLSLAAPHLHGVLVLVAGNKFVAGLFFTSDNCSSAPLSPEKNFFAGVVDTGDKHSFTNISAKKFKMPPMECLGNNPLHILFEKLRYEQFQNRH
jgi:hypothetical protein